MPFASEIDIARILYRSGATTFTPTGQVSVNLNSVPASLIAYLGNNGMLVDGEIAPHAKILLEIVRAEDRATKTWLAEGGPASNLGMPIGDKISVRSESDKWIADFRSGAIEVLTHETKAVTFREMIVEFVGIECLQRQEGSDEIYGVVAVSLPSIGKANTISFPHGVDTLKMGPDGLRIQTFNTEIYRGREADVVFVGTLIEHDDFEDVDEAAQKIADKIQEVAGQIFGAQTGFSGEAIAGQSGVKDLIADGLSFIMDNILGLGDDPYPDQTLRVSFTEMGRFGPPRQPPRVRSDDNKIIEKWTHKVKMMGVDDGGSVGEYDLFFDIRIEETTRIGPVSHPI